MSNTTVEGTGTTDPRVLRTRRMLMDALAGLLQEKGFNDISIQEIVDRATLNRATFYLHYPDKNALLCAMAEFRLRDLLLQREASLNGTGMLQSVALSICEYLLEITECPVKGSQLPLETSMLPVIESTIQRALVRHPGEEGAHSKLLARTLAWAVFGAATLWFTSPNRISPKRMAAKIDELLRPLVAPPSQTS